MNIIKSSKKSIFVEYFTYETSNYNHHKHRLAMRKQY